MIPDKGKNPGSPSDAKKIRKDENSEIGERSSKTLEEDVEAEMTDRGQAEVRLREGRDS